jgi:hypothetical protein
MLALAGGLAGCAEPYYPAPPPAPPSPSPAPRRPPIDACGAAGMQYLVGRPVGELPQGYTRRYQRVIGQRAYVEDRFEAERLTIVFDEDTGRITRVRCG